MSRWKTFLVHDGGFQFHGRYCGRGVRYLMIGYILNLGKSFRNHSIYTFLRSVLTCIILIRVYPSRRNNFPTFWYLYIFLVRNIKTFCAKQPIELNRLRGLETLTKWSPAHFFRRRRRRWRVLFLPDWHFNQHLNVHLQRLFQESLFLDNEGSLERDGPHTGEVVLCWGLVGQARHEHMSDKYKKR